MKSVVLLWSALTPQQQLLAQACVGTLGFLGILNYAPILLPWIGSKFTAFRFPSTRSKRRGEIEIAGIRLTDDARMRHTHILGATGSGKTVLMEHLLYRDLARGYGALIIDPKGERDLYDRVKAYCRKIGRQSDLHLLSSTHMEESSRWNPCRLGTASELQSKFFGASRYSHDFYAKAVEFGLQRAFKNLDKRSTERLGLMDLLGELEHLSQGGKDDNLKGLYFDLQNLSFGEWAPILGTEDKPGCQDEVSVLNVTRKNEILFVDLPTEGKAVQSSRIGALLLQEVTLLSGIRKRMQLTKSDRPFSVFVDEFDAFATESFVTFLNKGRSSEFMIHLAHQTLADLQKVSPTFMGQIMGNPNIRFIFRLDFPDDAERFGKLFGTKAVSKQTHQTEAGQATGRGSEREVQEFRVHPDTIKDLKTGECILGVKTSGFLKKIRIPPLDMSRLPSPKVPTQRDPIQPGFEPSDTVPRSKIKSHQLAPSLASVGDEFDQLTARLEQLLKGKNL